MRIIRRNAANCHPTSIVTLATESVRGHEGISYNDHFRTLAYGIAMYVRLEGGRTTRSQSLLFSDPAEFWDWLDARLDRTRSVWLLCDRCNHDLALIDFWSRFDSLLLRMSDRDRDTLGIVARPAKLQPWTGLLVDNDPPVIIKCRDQQDRMLTVVDRENYWSGGIAKLAASVGLSAVEPDLSVSGHEPIVAATTGRVRAIQKAFCDLMVWWKSNDHGMFRYTAAGLSFGNFRHKFYKKNIVQHEVPAISKFERAGYFGGRLEMRFCGKYDGDVFGLDVNAMYPAMMYENEYPREYAGGSHCPGREHDPPSPLGRFTMAEVEIETDSETYPVRAKEGVIYPHGRYWTTLVGAELLAAVERGHVLNYGRWANYKLAPLFREFMEYWWNERWDAKGKGDGLKEKLCKSLMNSLYGKWAQMTPQWETEPGDFPPNADRLWIVLNPKTGKREKYRRLGGYVQREVERLEARNSFVPISAWTTADAREYMRRLVNLAGRKNVLYVVTDALFVTKEGYLNLLHEGYVGQGELGKLRLEASPATATFRALNYYELGTRKKRAGVPAGAELGPDGTFSYTEFASCERSFLVPDGRGLHARFVRKKLDSGATRGHVGLDGWIRPIVIDRGGEMGLTALQSGKAIQMTGGN